MVGYTKSSEGKINLTELSHKSWFENQETQARLRTIRLFFLDLFSTAWALGKG
jgi:hypothetical protein